jgi:hypothetical protein
MWELKKCLFKYIVLLKLIVWGGGHFRTTCFREYVAYLTAYTTSIISVDRKIPCGYYILKRQIYCTENIMAERRFVMSQDTKVLI